MSKYRYFAVILLFLLVGYYTLIFLSELETTTVRENDQYRFLFYIRCALLVVFIIGILYSLEIKYAKAFLFAFIAYILLLVVSAMLIYIDLSEIYYAQNDIYKSIKIRLERKQIIMVHVPITIIGFLLIVIIKIFHKKAFDEESN